MQRTDTVVGVKRKDVIERGVMKGYCSKGATECYGSRSATEGYGSIGYPEDMVVIIIIIIIIFILLVVQGWNGRIWQYREKKDATEGYGSRVAIATECTVQGRGVMKIR